MGITRLAKCLRFLNSLDEYNDRNKDINKKIEGNRVYMDFVSIVYKTQEKIAYELNYLLYSFILIKDDIINKTELNDNFTFMIMKYNNSIPQYEQLINILTNKSKLKTLDNLKNIINDKFINEYCNNIRSNNSINMYVYVDVVHFISDLLTKKLTDVEYVLIAFDGIPSFGKIQEQRQRRYMRIAFVEFKKNIISSKKKQNNHNNPIFKAREFYDKLYFQIDIKSAIDYVYKMYYSNMLQNDIKELMTDANKKTIIIEVINKQYGEGEKILIDKLIKDYHIYHDTKSYVFYSPDGDSVILCLYVYIKTKITKLTVVKAYSLNPSNDHNNQSQYVNVSTLYKNIIKIVEKYSHQTFNQTDKDAICTDFIFMINFYGNDFLHKIPTLDIGTTTADLFFIYAKYIKNNTCILKNINNKIHIDYNNLYLFIKELSEYEQLLMLDTYLSDVNDKNKIIKIFGDVFPLRYLLDYKNIVLEHKKNIYNNIINKRINGTKLIKQNILDLITKLNNTSTSSGKKYGDILMKTEIKDINTCIKNREKSKCIT